MVIARPQLNLGVRQHSGIYSMPTTFELNSRDDGAAMCLREDNRDYFVAELRGLNLNARARVGTYMSAGLADMFEEMATTRGDPHYSTVGRRGCVEPTCLDGLRSEAYFGAVDR